MPIKVYRPKGSKIYNYRGTVAGRRLRGTTGTTDRARAERIAAKKENEQWDCHLDGPEAILTFAKAALLYRSAGKPSRFLAKVADYWKDTLVKDIKPGAIRQSAMELYPGCIGASWDRQVITPTQAVINHCADLELCAPIRVKRFKGEKKIKKPILLDWITTFCAHARPDIGALALFMFATGCRISEARRLEWEDIDFKQRTILIRKTKNQQQRMPHMPQALLVALANLPRAKRPFYKSGTTLRLHWDQAIQEAAKAAPDGKFERLTFHSCRHGFATKLLRDGIDPKTAAWLGGWKSIQLFMDTYAHEIQDRSLTEGLFDQSLTRSIASYKQKQ
jgi:integrase